MTFPIRSILDNDFYKFSMQYAVFTLYRDVNVSYQFNNRDKAHHKFTPTAFEKLRRWVYNDLPGVFLQTEKKEGDEESELEYLQRVCPFYSEAYLQYLQKFRFCPSKQVELTLDETTGLGIMITGTWVDTILYEVVLMALVSEVYFTEIDTDWDYSGQEEKVREKYEKLVEAGCKFSEFGTRRRRTLDAHDLVIKVLAEQIANEKKQKAKGRGLCAGTSNVYLARKYDLTPVGTLAHEWFMAMSVLGRSEPEQFDFEKVNEYALKKWAEVYPSQFHTALTDTFTSKLFFNTVKDDSITKNYNLRQDSGDPMQWTDWVVVWYENYIGNPSKSTKRFSYFRSIILPTLRLIYSDSLNVEVATAIQKKVNEVNDEVRKKHKASASCTPFDASFGIGTFFTNDFQKKSKPEEKSKAMNMVIKLYSCQGKFVVKLSDNPGKHQGDKATFEEVRKQLERLGYSV
ncbi:nicotinate phosphoribosyltransferase [Nowakowskiella sp. JEL0407]|nr:nicotinate phosphoribosyltransferase [Nowakowskiella sp. JEL0407]